MAGYVVDQSGAVVPYARVTVTSLDNGSTRTATTDQQGRWVMAGMPSGNFNAKVEMAGFNTSLFNMNYNANEASAYNIPVNVAAAAETVEVTAQAAQLQTSRGAYINDLSEGPINGRSLNGLERLGPGVSKQNASVNVLNLQKRVSGVLPVPVEVPREGTSFSFVRPLVLDEETKVTFSYKTR